MTNVEIRNTEIKRLTEKGASVEEYKTLVIVRDYTREDRPIVKMWRGNAFNAFSNYYYRSIESAERTITETKKSEDSREAWKAERKAKKQAVNNQDIEIGAIFYDSWGYEQTNIDFYQVIDKIGKRTLIVKEIASQSIRATGPMSDEVKAVKDAFTSEEMKVMLTDNDSFKIKGYRWASKWDGRALHRSWYA